MVDWAPPPPDRAVSPSYDTLSPGRKLYRVYTREPHNFIGNTFRYWGPLVRFDHHRPELDEDGKTIARLDEARGILYASESIACCMVEVFYSSGTISAQRAKDDATYRLATLRVDEPLRLLRLHGVGAIHAGTTVAISAVEHSIVQPWARYFYETPEIYGDLDGVSYANSHDGKIAIALFERASRKLSVQRDDPFTDEGIWPLLTTVAAHYRFPLKGFKKPFSS